MSSQGRERRYFNYPHPKNYDIRRGQEIMAAQQAAFERCRTQLLQTGTFDFADQLERTLLHLNLPLSERTSDKEGQELLGIFHKNLGIGNFQSLTVLYGNPGIQEKRVATRPISA